MKKKLSTKYLLPLFLLFALYISAQKPAAAKVTKASTPKLVLAIVVDQMRYDYIWKYWNKFGNGGFKKLVNEGFFCKNTHFNYVPTYTAPGHASIFTGSTPATHGIIGNNWFDKKEGKFIYCVDDWSTKPIGTTQPKGQKSPKRMLVTTVTDQLRMSNLKKSKTFAFAIKDRSAILPAGHMANGAFWYDGATGNFVTSSFYMENLPEWLSKFNDRKLPKEYLSKGWKPLLPIEQYTESLEDNSKYEYAPMKPESPTFPYFFAPEKIDAITLTPFGNTITKDVAIACLQSEQLGKDEYPDLLSISFSCTDIIGHNFGTKAIETEDAYIRLDKDIEELLIEIEKQAGKGNYSVFLTADHGGAENSVYLQDNKAPAGLIDEQKFQKEIKGFLHGAFGDSLVLSYANQQVHLDHGKIWEKKLNTEEIIERLRWWLMNQTGVAEVYTAKEIKYNNYSPGDIRYLIQRGFNHQQSGDVIVNYLPAWMEYEDKGTTHGTPYSYDTHVPLIFYGTGFKKGSSVSRVEISDIAPTIAQLLNIEYPNGCIGNPVKEALTEK